MQNIRVFIVYHFFYLIQGFLLNYRDIPHGCFLVCELLCCGGRSSIEAMKIRMILLENLAYHTKASLPYSQPDFFYPIFCLHRKQLQCIARYSFALDHFFVSAFNERRQTNLKVLINFRLRQYIYTSIDTILCLVLIRWKIFQGIYIKWHPERWNKMEFWQALIQTIRVCQAIRS